MFEPVSIIESIETGRRTINFLDERGMSMVRDFGDEGRASLLVDGTLYDWYGSEVKVDESIREIVCPFGLEEMKVLSYSESCPNRVERKTIWADRFLVKNQSDEYTLAVLGYIVDDEADTERVSSLRRARNEIVNGESRLWLVDESSMDEVQMRKFTGVLGNGMTAVRLNSCEDTWRFWHPNLPSISWNETVPMKVYRTREDALAGQFFFDTVGRVTEPRLLDELSPDERETLNKFMSSGVNEAIISEFTHFDERSGFCSMRIMTDAEVNRNNGDKPQINWYLAE